MVAGSGSGSDYPLRLLGDALRGSATTASAGETPQRSGGSVDESLDKRLNSAEMLSAHLDRFKDDPLITATVKDEGKVHMLPFDQAHFLLATILFSRHALRRLQPKFNVRTSVNAIVAAAAWSGLVSSEVDAALAQAEKVESRKRKKKLSYQRLWWRRQEKRLRGRAGWASLHLGTRIFVACS